MNCRNTVTPALLAGGYSSGLPMRGFLLGALSREAQDAALAHERLDAGGAQLGGFFNQPIHALVGGHADGQMHLPRGLTLKGVMDAHLHLHVAAPHALDLRFKFAALTVEKHQCIARLHAQHLHMPCSCRIQIERAACL